MCLSFLRSDASSVLLISCHTVLASSVPLVARGDRQIADVIRATRLRSKLTGVLKNLMTGSPPIMICERSITDV